MSFLDRIRRANLRDLETESRLGITRNEPQAISRADIRRLEEERAPWLRRRRSAHRRPD